VERKACFLFVDKKGEGGVLLVETVACSIAFVEFLKEMNSERDQLIDVYNRVLSKVFMLRTGGSRLCTYRMSYVKDGTEKIRPKELLGDA
jgi:hypothetical protein